MLCGKKPKAVLTDKLDSGPLVCSLLILDCKNVPKRTFLVPARSHPFEDLGSKLDSGPLVGSLLILDCKNVPKRIVLVPAKVSRA